MCSLAKDIGIDLGTASVLVYIKGKGVVLNEPSVVAIDKNTGRLLKVGAEAQAMLGRTPGNIVAIRPLRDGVISDYDMTERMLKEFIRKVTGVFHLFPPRIMVCVPSGITEVEERAVIDAGIQAGARRVYLIEEPVAAAIGAGIDIAKPDGHMVVDIGGGVTDVAVYYRNVVRYIATIPMGATAINRDIRTMSVPEKHVESLKQKYGSAVAELAPEDKLIRVNGRTAREAKDILLRNLATVIEARATDIAEFVLQEIKDSGYIGKLAYGIVLTGGSAKLKDLDELFRRVTGMDVRVASAETGIAEESKEKAADPAYATAVGILLKGAEQGACAFVERPVARPAEQQGFRPPQPQPAPEFRHTPRFQQPVQAPPAAPAAEEAEEDAAAEREEAPVIEPKRKRDWGSIFQKTFDKINKSFTAAEDEEI